MHVDTEVTAKMCLTVGFKIQNALTGRSPNIERAPNVTGTAVTIQPMLVETRLTVYATSLA